MKNSRVVLSIVGVAVALYLLCRQIIEEVQEKEERDLNVKPVDFLPEKEKELGSAVGVPRIPVDITDNTNPNVKLTDYAPVGADIEFSDDITDANVAYQEALLAGGHHPVDDTGVLPSIAVSSPKTPSIEPRYSYPNGVIPVGTVIGSDTEDTKVLGVEAEYNEMIRPINER